MDANTLELTVLLVARNIARHLPTWLAHLEQQDYPAAKFEVLVVDNGSTDGTVDLLRRYAAGSAVRTRCISLQPMSAVKALNMGIYESAGRYTLFLEHDVLASPGLVERHILAQQVFENGLCAVGNISAHPRLADGALTRWFLPEMQRKLPVDQPLHFLDCQMSNMSLPRRLLLSCGGFSEAHVFPGFIDSELAWRLMRQGVQAYYLEDASAYIWLPTDFEMERHNQYGRGYSLRRLLETTHSREITRRYSVRGNPLRAIIDAVVMPFYIRACQQTEVDTRMLGHIYRRILRHELYCGFHDARKRRPPRRIVPPE